MDRLLRWGIVFDYTNPGVVTASWQDASVSIPITPDEPSRAAFIAAWTVLRDFFFCREVPPTVAAIRRHSWLTFLTKFYNYRKHLSDIDAQIATYPNPNNAPIALRSEQSIIAVKLQRMATLRDQYEAQLTVDD